MRFLITDDCGPGLGPQVQSRLTLNASHKIDAIAYEMSRSGEIASETRSFQLTVGGAGKRKMVEREKKPGKKKQRTAEQ